MGAFDFVTDAFTGRPAKEAAAANTARLNALQTTGMGYLDSGRDLALSSLGRAKDAYDPLKALGAKYGGATTLNLDSLGVNGPEGNTRATAAFRESPGYRYSVDQSLDGINRHAAATGVAAGGNTLAALGDRAGHMADQEFGNWQTKLGSYVSPELAATSGAAGGVAGADMSIANLYTGDANSRVGLAGNVTNGINDATTQSANAQMAGSKNLWGAALNGAAAYATGGTSLLGGARDFTGTGVVPGGPGGPGVRGTFQWPT